MKMMKISLLAFAFGVLLAMPQLTAQSVNWGGSGSFSVLSYDSHGNQDVNLLTWELGWFSDGYTPDATNYLTWASNWNSVDVGSHYLYGDGTYNTNEVVANPGNVGKQIYIFVHNGGTDKDVWGPLMGTPQGEALIMTEGLTFLPTPSPAITFDIADNPYDNADNNLTVIWGRVDRNMYRDDLWGGGLPVTSPAPLNGGVIWNAGIISNPIPNSVATPYDDLNGTFESQTATWSAVPEPTGALVVGGLGLLVFMRRRR
jgi:MYXO-CTERM domain-containing protein